MYSSRFYTERQEQEIFDWAKKPSADENAALERLKHELDEAMKWSFEDMNKSDISDEDKYKAEMIYNHLQKLKADIDSLSKVKQQLAVVSGIKDDYSQWSCLREYHKMYSSVQEHLSSMKGMSVPTARTSVLKSQSFDINKYRWESFVPNLYHCGLCGPFNPVTELELARRQKEISSDEARMPSWSRSDKRKYTPKQKAAFDRWYKELREDADEIERTGGYENNKTTEQLKELGEKVKTYRDACENGDSSEVFKAEIALSKHLKSIERTKPFEHFEGGKYSIKNILLALATMGISIAFGKNIKNESEQKGYEKLRDEVIEHLEPPKP